MTLLNRRAVAHKVLNSERFQAELAVVADHTGKPLTEARKEASIALREMVSLQIPFFGFLLDRGIGSLHTRAWSVEVDWTALKLLQHENANKSLVFLPTHRSYADPYILMEILRSIRMPRNYILGGDNLRFFPLGAIGRRAGVVFIRRSFGDDEVYKLVVREYMRYLVASGANLEWYMEGGRSRTGKLRPPKYGLLKDLVEAMDSGATEDILLVPVSITYDQLQEVEEMAAEEEGAAKAKEGVRWLAAYVRAQNRNLGKVYVRFGESFSIRGALPREAPPREAPPREAPPREAPPREAPPREAPPREDSQPLRWTLDKIAFEVFQRINQVTPVTAPALVTLALLSVRDHALTLQEVHDVIEPLLDYASRRGLPTTALGDLHGTRGLDEVLGTLVQSGVAGRHDGGLAPVFSIEPGKHSVAAYYRNSAIHWFVNRAIVELGIMISSGKESADAVGRGRDVVSANVVLADVVLALRDLLKFEFFFSEKPVFLEEIRAEEALLEPDTPELVCARPTSLEVLERAPFLIAHRVLPAFVEAYFIVADRLAAHPSDEPVDQKAFVAQCIAVGRQYVLQKRLRNPECVGRELFTNALVLAANRGLLRSGAERLADGRRRFAEETAAALAGVVAIGELDDRLRHTAQPLH